MYNHPYCYCNANLIIMAITLLVLLLFFLVVLSSLLFLTSFCCLNSFTMLGERSNTNIGDSGYSEGVLSEGFEASN